MSGQRLDDFVADRPQWIQRDQRVLKDEPDFLAAEGPPFRL